MVLMRVAKNDFTFRIFRDYLSDYNKIKLFLVQIPCHCFNCSRWQIFYQAKTILFNVEILAEFCRKSAKNILF